MSCPYDKTAGEHQLCDGHKHGLCKDCHIRQKELERRSFEDRRFSKYGSVSIRNY